MDEHKHGGHKARGPGDEADLAVDSEREPEGKQYQHPSSDHKENLHISHRTFHVHLHEAPLLSLCQDGRPCQGLI